MQPNSISNVQHSLTPRTLTFVQSYLSSSIVPYILQIISNDFYDPRLTWFQLTYFLDVYFQRQFDSFLACELLSLGCGDKVAADLWVMIDFLFVSFCLKTRSYLYVFSKGFDLHDMILIAIVIIEIEQV